jgi:hypothetical protein
VGNIKVVCRGGVGFGGVMGGDGDTAGVGSWESGGKLKAASQEFKVKLKNLEFELIILYTYRVSESRTKGERKGERELKDIILNNNKKSK